MENSLALDKSLPLIETAPCREYSHLPENRRRYHEQRDFLAYWTGHPPNNDISGSKACRDWWKYTFATTEPLINGSWFGGECLIWRGKLTSNGYAPRKVQRLLWTETVGQPITGQLNHLCHRRACVQPSHLYDGSQVDNMADKHGSPFQKRSTPKGYTFAKLRAEYDRIWGAADRYRQPEQALLPPEPRRYLLHNHDWNSGSPPGSGGAENTFICSICNISQRRINALLVLNAMLRVGVGFEDLPDIGHELWSWREYKACFQETTWHGGSRVSDRF